MNLGNKGMCKQRAKLGKRSNNSKDNKSIIKASSSVSKAKICLSSTIQIHWNLREGSDNIFLALWLRSTTAWTLLIFALILNWILLCSSPLLNMHIPPKPSSSWITAMSWWRDLHTSKKQWAMLCRDTQDEQVIVESSDKTWSSAEENGKTFQDSCHKNPMNTMKRQKDMTLKDEHHPDQKVSNMLIEKSIIRIAPRKKEETGSKQKWHSAVDVTGGENKDWCCKEWYCTGSWKVNSMN